MAPPDRPAANPAMHPAPSPTVVLLHSSASSARQWEGMIKALRPQFRVHAVEFHGHGAQPEWQGATRMTLADEAALVAPLLAQAGGAHLVGHSYGAAVALKLATLHPGLVRSLVAYEPVLFRCLIDDLDHHWPAQDVVVTADAIRSLLASNQAQAAARRFVDFWSGAGAWQSLPAGKQGAIAARMPAVTQHFDALFADTMQPAQLARLGLPMLFLSGARTVAAMRRLAGVLRLALLHADHEVLPDMGHMGPITHAPQVNRRIAQFLNARLVPPSEHRFTRSPGRAALPLATTP
jgi:pimeloyl-ACP methyl ester carboxylesterase